ncbi:NB-ARC domain-containing protein [Streptomyces sp. WAC 06738]|uniref:NB-ARC domain-containing protein n=1 Tax=Streptomyces sp. WAC 06738 TaxID=2203210 RepID=UPI000F7A4840|nr:NB-ARC domain-containing protein [Streptomyces sp. WAC 06738]
MILRYVLDHLSEPDALGDSFERAADRRHADSSDDELSIVEYLDMREAYDILNRHREALPVELARELRHGTPRMDTLVPIRNRVMHGRPLQAGDAEKAVSVCRDFKSRFWPTLRDTLDRLGAHPDWEPAFNGSDRRYSDRILHNLPPFDYDDTGLIGRSQACTTIVKHLLRRREPMITITGEGGIGKTALASDVAYSLLDNPDSPYECILWTSLKTERLTANGVVSIAGAVRDITGATQSLGKILADDFKGGAEELAEALTGIETLLIIDNLETVSGSEIVTLYETLPDNVTYLMTSRIGIGQIERRIPLPPLAEKDAQTLFRAFARVRGGRAEFLSRLKQETVAQIVARLRFSPLAIRWYVLSVESGREPHPTLTDQDELIDFCVRSVFDALSETPKSILSVLYALERASTFDELAVLTDSPIDALNLAVKELSSGSLVSQKPDPDDELVSRVQITEAAQHFLRRVAPPSKTHISNTLLREQEFKRSEEQRRADESKRQLAPNVVRIRSPHDEPTAHLLRLALARSRAGNIESARSYITRARSLNPEFWEVDRVEAFILSSQNQIDQASAAYRSALRKADNAGKAVIAYYFAGHLAGRAHDVNGALPLAESAYEHFRTADTAQLLGKIHLWARNYEESQVHLEWALENITGRGRLRLIIMTNLVDSWRRWSESLLEDDRRPLEAAHKASAGFSQGIKELDSGAWDQRLAEILLESANAFLRAIGELGTLPARLEMDALRILKGVKNHSVLFERCAAWRHFPGRVGRLYRLSGVNDEVVSLCEDLVHITRPNPADGSSDSPRGIVKAWRGTFGFIAHPDYPSDVFFPGSVVQERHGVKWDSTNPVGFHVAFEVDEHGRGDRPRANFVSPILTEE